MLERATRERAHLARRASPAFWIPDAPPIGDAIVGLLLRFGITVVLIKYDFDMLLRFGITISLRCPLKRRRRSLAAAVEENRPYSVGRTLCSTPAGKRAKGPRAGARSINESREEVAIAQPRSPGVRTVTDGAITGDRKGTCPRTRMGLGPTADRAGLELRQDRRRATLTDGADEGLGPLGPGP